MLRDSPSQLPIEAFSWLAKTGKLVRKLHLYFSVQPGGAEEDVCLQLFGHFNIPLQIRVPIIPTGILKVKGAICSVQGPGMEKI